jgi:hypothetical protein
LASVVVAVSPAAAVILTPSAFSPAATIVVVSLSSAAALALAPFAVSPPAAIVVSVSLSSALAIALVTLAVALVTSVVVVALPLFRTAALVVVSTLAAPTLALLAAPRTAVTVVPVPSPPAGTRLATGRWRWRRGLRGWWRWRRLHRRGRRSRWGRLGGRRRRNRLRPSLALRGLSLPGGGDSRGRRRSGPRPRRRCHAHEVRRTRAPHAPLRSGDLPGMRGHALLDLHLPKQVERVERDLRQLLHLGRRNDQQGRRRPTGVDRGPPEVARAHRRSNERGQPQDCGGQHQGQFGHAARRRG